MPSTRVVQLPLTSGPGVGARGIVVTTRLAWRVHLTGAVIRLKGKVAVITGAGQGIGRADAHRFAQEGARVVVAELHQATAATVAQEVQQEGGQALAVATDVADPVSVQQMVGQAQEGFGPVDVLVNNASQPGGPTTLQR